MDKEIRDDEEMARYEIEWMEKQKIIDAHLKMECPNCKEMDHFLVILT